MDCNFRTRMLRLLVVGAVASVSNATLQAEDVGPTELRHRQIAAEVSGIRRLDYTNEVSMAYQTPDDFKAYILASLGRHFGEAGPDAYINALVKLGALKKHIDLTETYVSLAQSQAAAHYDPAKDTYFYLMTNMPPMLNDATAAHELCHALQDHHYNLTNLLEGNLQWARDNADAVAARQCLIEGDATYVMTAWMLMEQAGTKDLDKISTVLAMAINMQTMISIDTLMDADAKQFEFMGEDADFMRKAMRDMKKLPRFFIESLYAAYIRGSIMVHHVKLKGGWKAINALYKHPPRSTEQILHPEKLVDQPDEPIAVKVADLKDRLPQGWSLEEEDVMGELGIRILFRIWRKNQAAPPSIDVAATGWGGDRYYYLEHAKTGKDLLVWKTVWDTKKDAGEFAASYKMLMKARFPKRKMTVVTADEKKGPGESLSRWELAEGRWLELRKLGKTVTIVDTTDRGMLKRW